MKENWRENVPESDKVLVELETLLVALWPHLSGKEKKQLDLFVRALQAAPAVDDTAFYTEAFPFKAKEQPSVDYSTAMAPKPLCDDIYLSRAVRDGLRSKMISSYRNGIKFTSREVADLENALKVKLTEPFIEALKSEMFLSSNGSYYIAENVLPNIDMLNYVMREMVEQVQEHGCLSIECWYKRCQGLLSVWRNSERDFSAFAVHLIRTRSEVGVKIIAPELGGLCVPFNADEHSLLRKLRNELQAKANDADLGKAFYWLSGRAIELILGDNNAPVCDGDGESDTPSTNSAIMKLFLEKHKGIFREETFFSDGLMKNFGAKKDLRSFFYPLCTQISHKLWVGKEYFCNNNSYSAENCKKLSDIINGLLKDRDFIPLASLGESFYSLLGQFSIDSIILPWNPYLLSSVVTLLCNNVRVVNQGLCLSEVMEQIVPTNAECDNFLEYVLKSYKRNNFQPKSVEQVFDRLRNDHVRLKLTEHVREAIINIFNTLYR